MPASRRPQRAASRGNPDVHPLDVRSLSAFSPAQQRLLRALLDAELPASSRPTSQRPTGGSRR